jgi:4'-phosphopantetheinyl transferase
VRVKTPPALEAGEAHVWRVEAGETPEVAGHEGVLSADERERAERMPDEGVRRRYVAGRAMLRRILAGYAGRAPEGLRFVYGEHGKPGLPGEVEFNMTDSRGMLLYAVTRGRRVGIDVEGVRPGVSVERLARRYFAPPEWEAVSAARAEEREEMFFTLWTRKEAFVKAIGAGLSFPLRDFVVTTPPDPGGVRLVSVRGSGAEGARWSVLPLCPGRGFTATLVVEGPMPRVRLLDGEGLWRLPRLFAGTDGRQERNGSGLEDAG